MASIDGTDVRKEGGTVMEGEEIYRFLEKQFIDTFLGELIPGIFHNYANPLNGIMGRSNLMQRRLLDFVKKIEARYPDVERELGADYKKLIADINAINNESDKFHDMFRASSGKFYAIANHGVETLNLSKLIEAEMGFSDFYLDFKHNIKKDIRLDLDVPDISGITGYYSMALWMLIRLAMSGLRDCRDKVFSIETGHQEGVVFIKISGMGRELMSGWKEGLVDFRISSMDGTERYKLSCALLLLKQGSQDVDLSYDEDTETLTIRVPYRHAKAQQRN